MYVAACPVCCQSKSSRRPYNELLQQLPVPSRPLSDISLDFTGLPPSHVNTTMLSVVDKFSKMAHFIPLANPPLFPVLVPSALALARC